MLTFEVIPPTVLNPSGRGPPWPLLWHALTTPTEEAGTQTRLRYPDESSHRWLRGSRGSDACSGEKLITMHKPKLWGCLRNSRFNPFSSKRHYLAVFCAHTVHFSTFTAVLKLILTSGWESLPSSDDKERFSSCTCISCARYIRLCPDVYALYCIEM